MAETTQDGNLQRVTVEMLGSALTTAAAVSDTTITVDWAVDFPEPDEGETGLLRIGGEAGVEYEYDAVDKDADTIHLTSPVTVAAAEGDPVDAMIAPASQAQEWTAWVEPADEDAEPLGASIPHSQIPYFFEGEDQAGAAVRYVDDGSGGFRVVALVDSESIFDGAAVWNPYVSRRALTEAIPNSTWEALEDWTDVVSQGVTIQPDGSVTILHPGLYAVHASPTFATNVSNGRRARIMVNGVQVGYLGIPADSAGTTDVAISAHPILAEGDSVTIEVFQNSGATLNVTSGAGLSGFALYRISV